MIIYLQARVASIMKFAQKNLAYGLALSFLSMYGRNRS
jgi:hypothetical protein